MNSWYFGLFITILIFLSCHVQPWSGNTCDRTHGNLENISICSNWSVEGCLEYEYEWRMVYRLETFCCPGWTHNGNLNCSITICSPPCQNGGTCISPNTCVCRDGFQGDICSGIATCSHLMPCYPGRCYGSSSNSQCLCSDGFYGTTCNTLASNDFKPLIEKGNATFAKYLYTQGSRMLYRYMTDATNSTTTDLVWTNQPEFNDMKFDIDASLDAKYMFDHLPPLPRYIRNQTFGIVEAKVNVKHYKLNRDKNEELINEETFTCDGPSDRTPIADVTMECNLSNGTNHFQVDSGDIYLLTYTVTTGGYRELIDTNTNNLYSTDIYNGISSHRTMEFRFDRDPPVHCSESNSCSGIQTPFQLEQDVTKQPLKPHWDGWTDALSGIARYSFEVWKMEYIPDHDVLREPEIRSYVNPVPEFISSQDVGNTTRPVYEPKTPGVYSTILEVVDRANNSRYARRIAIFDKESSITSRSEFPLYVVSANNESNYEWQTTPNSGSSPSATVSLVVSWRNHFINQIHEDGHFLKRILEFAPRLSDNISRINYKKIDSTLDDNEGERTIDAISNVNSIVKFEFNYGMVSSAIPSIGWEHIPLFKQSKTKVLLGEAIRDGDTRKIWIRAYDVMGNTKVDSTVIRFDNSPPLLYATSNAVEKNLKDGNYPFSSRVTVEGKDKHSGIKKVSFKFIVVGTGEIKSQHNFLIDPKSPGGPCPGPSCNCVGQLCYEEQTVLEMNNCWLRVPIDRIENDEYELEISLYNSAMLSSSRTIQLGIANAFGGIQEYFSPSNITVLRTTDTSLSINWVQAPTCYERAGILIRLFRPAICNMSQDIIVHKDATSFDLTGLSASTSYCFELYTKYGNDTHFKMSNPPAVLQFTTAEPRESEDCIFEKCL